MIDRILIARDRKSATLIFDNREPFTISSDRWSMLLELIELFTTDRRKKPRDEEDLDKWPQPTCLEDTYKIVA